MYVRLLNLAIREGSTSETLPEPENLPFESADEMEFIYDLWTIWAATDKRYLPSQLIPELRSGYGRILQGIMDMEALYAKTKEDLNKKKPHA